MATINSKGQIVVLSQSQWLERIKTIFRNAFGNNLRMTPETPQGQLAANIAALFSNQSDATLALYNAANINTAVGSEIDRLCEFFGIIRNKKINARALITVTGVPATQIPAQHKIKNEAGDIYLSETGYTLPSGGRIQVVYVAQETIIASVANTINIIIDSVVGLETVNNAEIGTQGVQEETDATLRQRFIKSIFKNNKNTKNSILSGIYTVLGVKSAILLENPADSNQTINGVTLTPHSLYIVVDGGLNNEVGMVIANKKTLGTNTINVFTNAENKVEYDVDGSTYPIRFDRPKIVFCSIKIEYTLGTAVESAFESQIKLLIMNYINNNNVDQTNLFIDQMGVGQPLFLDNISALIRTVQGVQQNSISATKKGETASTSSKIEINANELILIETSNDIQLVQV